MTKTKSAAAPSAAATKAIADGNAEAKKIAKEIKRADVTTIALGLSREAAEFVKNAVNASDANPKLRKSLVAEISSQLEAS